MRDEDRTKKIRAAYLEHVGTRLGLWGLPAESAQKMSPDSLAKQVGGEFSHPPTVVPDASGDVVLLFETGELSLKHVAAALVDSRLDLTEVASRLHTRSDVTWTPLLG